MKLSFYNYYISYDNYYIYYNSFSNNYLLISNKLNETFSKYKNNIDELELSNSGLYNSLLNGGFIVDNELNEKDIVLFEKTQQKFRSSNYNVMLNPTLDCNLKCWYCFENHESKSSMSHGVKGSIIKNIELKYAHEPFSQLSIGFFGGEPLIKTKNVVIPFIKEASKFANEKGVKLKIGITTNGTLISDELLSLLKPYDVFFQITFDGKEELHNKVRAYKNGNQKSFSKIITNLQNIKDKLDNYFITLRINYDNETLDGINEIVDSLSFLDPTKVAFHLNRVWQIKIDEIDKEKLINAAKSILDKNYIADICTLSNGGSACYADNYNQLLVNYNGQVFKCSSRDFKDENKEGVLLDNGTVEWDTNKFSKRMGLQVLDMCKSCRLLPTCPNHCSQTILEAKDPNEIPCYLENNPLSFEDYIAYNFLRNSLVTKLGLI